MRPNRSSSSGNKMNRREDEALALVAERFMLSILARGAAAAFGPKSKMWSARVFEVIDDRHPMAYAPNCSCTSRATSVPSARPLVSRMTYPTIGPIALALP
jgi:hypothetical protein